MQNLNGYLAALASDAPAPGGGSAAMLVGAAGCALVAMVARICAGSNKYAQVKDTAEDLASQSDQMREAMLELGHEDERAFEAVVAARGDKDAMQRALERAAAVPLRGASAALRVLDLCDGALHLGNANLISDVGCAAEFAFAALAACAYNVRINHKFMKDADLVQTQGDALVQLEIDAQTKVDAIRLAARAMF